MKNFQQKTSFVREVLFYREEMVSYVNLSPYTWTEVYQWVLTSSPEWMQAWQGLFLLRRR